MATSASRWAASCSAKRRAAGSSRPTRSRRGVVLNAAVILKDPTKLTETIGRDRGRREDGRADAEGDRLAEGGRPHRPVHQRGPAWCSTSPSDHLHRRAGHHQQRAGDGHPPARAGDRHAAGDRRPAPLHPGDAGDRGAGASGSSSAAWAPGWAPCSSASSARSASRPSPTSGSSSSRGRGCTRSSAPATSIAAFVIVLLVSAFSSFYPAWLATRVTPRQAMQEDE